MRTRLGIASLILLFQVLPVSMPIPASAQDVQFGSDTRPMSLQTCISCSQQALSTEGMSPQRAGNITTGRNNNGVVMVTCAPESNGSFIVVTGISNVAGMAEGLRNRVREHVFGCRSLD